jgi:oxygen-independent coproporphyrinogen-3 oxidase
MQILAEVGVTRISIGVQSFNDDVLHRCNRRHTIAQTLEAVATARKFIPDTGIDLIAGLPGVTEEDWHDTLSQALDLNLPHLSIYALSIDEGSAWARAGMTPPDAEYVCNAIAEAEQRLAAAGLQRYETSNYAREGYQCQHNLNTWHGGDYVGLGRGAASRIGTLRRATSGDEERLDPLEDALERALTQLCLAEGFDVAQIIQRYPLLAPFADAWKKTLATLRQHHLLHAHNAPTTRGYEVLDAIERSLLEATL